VQHEIGESSADVDREPELIGSHLISFQ
jgi:hypothetical protein